MERLGAQSQLVTGIVPLDRRAWARICRRRWDAERDFQSEWPSSLVPACLIGVHVSLRRYLRQGRTACRRRQRPRQLRRAVARWAADRAVAASIPSSRGSSRPERDTFDAGAAPAARNSFTSATPGTSSSPRLEPQHRTRRASRRAGASGARNSRTCAAQLADDCRAVGRVGSEPAATTDGDRADRLA